MNSLPKPTILYEDNHLVAVNKPAGLATQPSREHAVSLEDQLKAELKAKYNKPGAVFLHPVHRLDRPVSGIVLFAKTSKALTRLNEQMREHRIRKIYQCLVDKEPAASQDELVHYLRHDDFRAEVVTPQTPHSQEARLTYRRLPAPRPGICALEVELHTGRYHQIRAQLGASGWPITGDKKYGSKQSFGTNGDTIALHHYQMHFEHPVTKEPVVITTPPPWLS